MPAAYDQLSRVVAHLCGSTSLTEMDLRSLSAYSHTTSEICLIILSYTRNFRDFLFQLCFDSKTSPAKFHATDLTKLGHTKKIPPLPHRPMSLLGFRPVNEPIVTTNEDLIVVTQQYRDRMKVNKFAICVYNIARGKWNPPKVLRIESAISGSIKSTIIVGNKLYLISTLRDLQSHLQYQQYQQMYENIPEGQKISGVVAFCYNIKTNQAEQCDMSLLGSYLPSETGRMVTCQIKSNYFIAFAKELAVDALPLVFIYNTNEQKVQSYVWPYFATLIFVAGFRPEQLGDDRMPDRGEIRIEDVCNVARRDSCLILCSVRNFRGQFSQVILGYNWVTCSFFTVGGNLSLQACEARLMQYGERVLLVKIREGAAHVWIGSVYESDTKYVGAFNDPLRLEISWHYWGSTDPKDVTSVKNFFVT